MNRTWMNNKKGRKKGGKENVSVVRHITESKEKMFYKMNKKITFFMVLARSLPLIQSCWVKNNRKKHKKFAEKLMSVAFYTSEPNND